MDMWYEDDAKALRALIIDQSDSLFVHIPSAFEWVARKADDINVQTRAYYIGRASPTLKHNLTKSPGKRVCELAHRRHCNAGRNNGARAALFRRWLRHS
jgi:hypothetical protein